MELLYRRKDETRRNLERQLHRADIETSMRKKLKISFLEFVYYERNLDRLLRFSY